MSGFYRVLGPTLGELGDGFVSLRNSPGWLIETNLATGCTELEQGEDLPWTDPCTWRHTWIYHVGPDGTLTLLFDAGDPEPMPDAQDATSD